VAQPDSPIHRYHDGTKHHFRSFARSLGYLDWATQPRPFRSYPGARAHPLFPSPGADAGSYTPRPAAYDSLFRPAGDPAPLSSGLLGDVLRHSLGLSAWKVLGRSRWSLRVNPSSGNLHPTEAYVVCGALSGLADSPAVYHYAAERHALEERCAFDAAAWAAAGGGPTVVLVALTSIHWRESWKYGERAFRYCQHDLGHAAASIALAAAMSGWQARILPSWPQRHVAILTGIDRDEDFVDAEREEPACVLALAPDAEVAPAVSPDPRLLHAIRSGRWAGRASQLSEDHVQWTFIDDVARATEDRGRPEGDAATPAGASPSADPDRALDARALVLQRRSAVAFDGVTSIGARAFFAMLSRAMPAPHAPWRVLWWPPRLHLLLFVHRVEGIAPGLYLLGRDAAGFDRLQASIRRHALGERIHDALPVICLARGDCRSMARRLSCDQDIAADGFFSLGMIAEFDASLAEYGPAFYRHLFWESGAIGQMLYLEAEAAGVRATGIGCFYDDPVHEVLGLEGHAFQSLYHFTVGAAVDDPRLTTETGYGWG
jgi:SagB-type dehydrogenase family enzyme